MVWLVNFVVLLACLQFMRCEIALVKHKQAHLTNRMEHLTTRIDILEKRYLIVFIPIFLLFGIPSIGFGIHQTFAMHAIIYLLEAESSSSQPSVNLKFLFTIRIFFRQHSFRCETVSIAQGVRSVTGKALQRIQFTSLSKHHVTNTFS